MPNRDPSRANEQDRQDVAEGGGAGSAALGEPDDGRHARRGQEDPHQRALHLLQEAA